MGFSQEMFESVVEGETDSYRLQGRSTALSNHEAVRLVQPR